MDHIPETTKKKHSLNPENLGHNNQSRLTSQYDLFTYTYSITN